MESTSPFSMKVQMPSTRSTKPWPPASTTPAAFSAGNWLGVLASETCAASRPCRTSAWMSRTPSATRRESSFEKSSSTVGSVPCTGFDIAVQAAAAPDSAAWASVSAVSMRRPATASRKPWKYCAMIAPELPRAPSSAASATWSIRSSTRRSGLVAVASRMVLKVNAMLVPVSPSGTGKTLMRLRYSRRWKTWPMPAESARRRRRASR